MYAIAIERGEYQGTTSTADIISITSGKDIYTISTSAKNYNTLYVYREKASTADT